MAPQPVDVIASFLALSSLHVLASKPSFEPLSTIVLLPIAPSIVSSIEPVVISQVEPVVVSPISPISPTIFASLIEPEGVPIELFVDYSEQVVFLSSSSIIHISSHPFNTIHLIVDLPYTKCFLAKVLNSHSMPTRGKSGIYKPKVLVTTLILSKPKDYKDALSILEWKASM